MVLPSLFFILQCSSLQATNVSVDVRASWDSTSFLHEALMYAKKRKLFWEYLNESANRTISRGSDIPQDDHSQYEHTKAVMQAILPHHEHSLFERVLSIRFFSVKVEACRRQVKQRLNGTSHLKDYLHVQMNSGTWITTSPEQTERFLQHRDFSILTAVGDNVTDMDSDCIFEGNTRGESDDIILTLVGSIDKLLTAKFHQVIHAALSKDSRGIHYRYQEIFSYSEADKDSAKEDVLGLSGYDVSFLVKNTEYVAHNTSGDSGNSQSDTATGKNLEIEIPEFDYSLIGKKSCVFIVRSSSPLENLVNVTENLPWYLREIDALPMQKKNSRRVIEAIDRSRNEHPTFYRGESSIFLHGQRFSAANTDIFTLIETVFEDLAFFESIRDVIHACIPEESHEIRQQLLESSLRNTTSGEALERVQRLHVPNENILWINDVEKDPMYSSFSADPKQLYLSPAPVPIRKNIFNLVYIIDPSRKSHLEMLFQTLQRYHQIPSVHIGISFINTDTSGAIVGSLGYLISTITQVLKERFAQNPRIALMFLSELVTHSADERISRHEVEIVLQKLFESYISHMTSIPIHTDIEAIFVENEKNRYAALAPCYLLNGVLVSPNDDAVGVYQREIANLFPLISKNIISHHTEDCYTEILNEFEAAERHHPIYRDEPEFLSTTDSIRFAHDFQNYVWFSKDLEEITPFKATFVFQFDIAHAQSLDLFSEAVEYVKNHAKSFERFSFIVHTSDRQYAPMVQSIHRSLRRNDISELENAVRKATKIYQTVNVDELPSFEEENTKPQFTQTPIVDCAPGESVLVLNGRIVRLSQYTTSGFPLGVDEYSRLAKTARQQMEWAYPSMTSLSDTTENTAQLSNALSIASAMLYKNTVIHDERFGSMPDATNDSLEGFTIGSDDDQPNLFHTKYSLCAIIDPLSPHASKALTLVQTLQKIIGGIASIYLNPTDEFEQRPMLHFTKHFIADDIMFTQTGELIPPTCTFTQLPRNPLLCLALREPESWVVFPEVTSLDLDNIRLAEDSNKNISISHRLRNFILQGRCQSASGEYLPTELSLKLQNLENSTEQSLIMGNLGYVQLHQLPGSSVLSVDENPSNFGLNRVQLKGQDLAIENQKCDVVRDSFTSQSLIVDLRRTSVDAARKQQEGLLPQLFSTVKKWLPRSITRHRQTVHIFSIASGHLYERLLRLMMYRLTASTNAHVKFWFIESFLSPRFKQLLPHFAEKYQCSYELVSYKWPHWLRKQGNKQRTIWAYKILFLDVLFPSSVDRIIFVDADQIVQSDIAELYNTDLHGKVIGMTPLCVTNSRNETMGYRFWNTGHWKEHLRGKPYHISALFVVDLKRFRSLGIGDIYRSSYENLSADPKNLANLDQDLPNYLQDAVPIFSLPQEWLWCESWCSTDSLPRAKTIDLCNNPLTKEPKIAVAKRVIPHWEEWDNELAAYEESLLKEDSSERAEL